MKIVIVLIFLVVPALAVPNTRHLNFKFKNLYKDPYVDMKVKLQQGKIVNGEIATPYSIPYQAFITFYDGNGGGWYCGGSLITLKTVLTAGHCGYNTVGSEIVLGATNLEEKNSDQIILETKNIIVHKKYYQLVNDIALVIFQEPVKLRCNIQLVKLPTKFDVQKSYNGQVAKVSGWGKTNGYGDHVYTDLRYIEDKIISNIKCSLMLLKGIPKSQVCLSGKNKRSGCNGDSGGPLTVNGVQVGIVSYGIKGCNTIYPSVYTRVTSFLDWISENSE